MSDTIFALATAQGRAGVAVIRISGGGCKAALEPLCSGTLPAHGRTLRVLRGVDGAPLDEALVLTFDKGASFTGEEVVELQCHGAPAVVRAVLKALADLGLRLAEPGEFTRRALENGCMDLTQVEGLSDLLAAETEAQRVQAQRIFQGELSERAGKWRDDLIRAAALIEATIDFADEDVPVDVTPEVRELLQGVQASLQTQQSGASAAERIRDGFEVAIIGEPNVGKSSLLNRLAKREAAITSDIAGTTRDVIEVQMEIAGLAVTLLDTAGLRESDDVIEQAGVALARDRAASADLRIILTLDGNPPQDVVPQADDLVLWAKSDLSGRRERDGISAKTGQGIDNVIEILAERLSNKVANSALSAHHRHQMAISAGESVISLVLQILDDGPERYEFAAAELRTAISALNSLIGHVDVESFLDEIFASFCLGK